MGEKELVITTPAPEEYIEGDEEALEASFQSLEGMLQVMIKEGYQPGKGLGPHLGGIPAPISVQENLGRFGLGYRGNDLEENTTLFKEEVVRGQLFVRGGMAAIRGEAMGQAEWEELTNWAIEMLPDQDFLEIKNNPISPIDNQTLGNEEPDQPRELGEGRSTEAEALADIERWIDKERPKFEAPTKDLESVNLGMEGREIRIGKQIPPDLRAKLIELLKNTRTFSPSHQKIVEHKLPLLPGSTPIRQQLRRMRPEVALKIKEEVEEQWNAGFLAVANYPQWVANIVPVPKKDGKVRMCVDYKDLNRASPKDNFPLPHIDVLVDNTAQHAFFSFMDGFSGYNQIMMLPEDQKKTTFITL
ncbi:hypothetical protein CR513_42840, partial [Mucuna pruriens]